MTKQELSRAALQRQTEAERTRIRKKLKTLRDKVAAWDKPEQREMFA